MRGERGIDGRSRELGREQGANRGESKQGVRGRGAIKRMRGDGEGAFSPG